MQYHRDIAVNINAAVGIELNLDIDAAPHNTHVGVVVKHHLYFFFAAHDPFSFT